MNIVSINPSQESCPYDVVVSDNCTEVLSTFLEGRGFSRVVAVVDRAVAGFWRELWSDITLNCSTIVWEGGEKRKGIAELQQLWGSFLENNLDRRSCVISVGGGAQGDLVGFAAATFKRGFSVVQVPTTLLSQVDASVGGKTGINFADIKNLLGVIHQPSLVLADIRSLHSLDKKELRSGMAEVIKHGLIRDVSYLTKYTIPSINRETARPFEELSDLDRISLITRSIEIKAEIAEADPFERGERKLLNFGHTIGHAIEALSHSYYNPLTHGEAIALGMVGEAKLSHLVGFITEDDLNQIKQSLSLHHLPIKLPFKISIAEIWEKILDDKKNVSGEIRWTLLEKIGNGKFDQVIPTDLVQLAVDEIS